MAVTPTLPADRHFDLASSSLNFVRKLEGHWADSVIRLSGCDGPASKVVTGRSPWSRPHIDDAKLSVEGSHLVISHTRTGSISTRIPPALLSGAELAVMLMMTTGARHQSRDRTLLELARLLEKSEADAK